MRPATQLIFPGAVLALALAAVHFWSRLPAPVGAILPLYSWFILALGVLIAWGFQRGRVALGLLALALAGEALRRLAPGQVKLSGALQPIPYDLVALLLPLNLALYVLLPERALLSPRGFARILLALGQAMFVVLAWRFQWPEVAAAARFSFIRPAWSLLTPLRQPALLAFAAALAAVLIQFYRRPRPIEAAFIAALFGAFLALHMPAVYPRLPAATLFIAAAQTALLLGVLMNSHAMAYRDELTGLPSRRALNELLPQLGRQYAIAMVDVDHFKKFNDRYGHDAGDQVLRMVAAKLADVASPGRAFRYGGEEFTIVFPGRSVEDSIDHLEHVRKSIERGGFVVRGPQRPKRVSDERSLRGRKPAKPGAKVRVTVSMGVAESSARLTTPHAVIQAADKALYRAKQAGRNQISE